MEMRIKVPKGESEIAKDPFLLLGYGINAYFDIMVSLSMMCICITLFMLPIFYVYSQNNEHGLRMYDKYAINQFSLGNLGGARSLCVTKRVGMQEARLTCPAGVMVVG